jgi:putative SOS response-associated peptidase YedK
MCGRYTLRDPDAVGNELRALQVEASERLPQRFNAAPSQALPTVAADGDGRPVLRQMQWGFVPYWEKAERPKLAPINARAETALEKGMFKQALQRRRCLIPADGLYEWKRTETYKQPFDIHLKGSRPFFFAGIYEAATELRPETFLLFTTQPNELMAAIHDRMPAILTGPKAREWLTPGPLSPEAFVGFTVPHAAADMEAVPVSSYVNNARNDGPDCLVPVLWSEPKTPDLDLGLG